MAYTYTPYEYESAVGGADQHSQFQDYAGQQFKSLFDIANINANQLQGFAQAPTYSPYSGTREDFTTHTPSYWEYNEQTQGGDIRPAKNVFDQQGYLDARFRNVNDYLGQLSSFLGNMGTGGSSAGVAHAEAQRAIQQANMPKVGSLSGYGGTPQVGGLSGFSQSAPGSNYGGWGGRQVSGGWGSHPVVGGLLG